MDAPIYPPAAEFVPPADAPFVLSMSTASLGELMTAPAAWAIVLKYAPALGLVAASPAAKANLSNLTSQTFVNLGIVTPAMVAAIDRDLARLPHAQGPKP